MRVLQGKGESDHPFSDPAPAKMLTGRAKSLDAKRFLDFTLLRHKSSWPNECSKGQRGR